MVTFRALFGLTKTHSDVQKTIDSANIRIAKIVLPIVMSLEAFCFAVSFFFQIYEDASTATELLKQHRIGYIILFLAALQLFVFTFFYKPEKSPNMHLQLTFSLYIFLLVSIGFSMHFSIQDYYLGEQIFLYLTFQLLVVGLFIIKPCYSFPTIIASALIFYFMMRKTGVSRATNIAFPIQILMFLIVSFVRYSTFWRISYYTVKTQCLNEQLRVISYQDALTKIKNRLCLQHDIQDYAGKRLIVMISDIDNFKGQNDTYGHEYGDKVLFKFAQTLKTVFGRNACYRYGGDEFVVILVNYPENTFLKDIESIKESLEDSLQFSGGYVTGTANTEQELYKLINEADKNLYKAKQKGKNCILR